MKKVLTKKIKQIPQKPGVYLFKDAGGRILYIGKARDILKRVKTHFSKSSNFFTGQFIEKISDIDWIKTENEKQALLLEDQLIKKYKPRYNIQWRDDKSYFWVVFSEDKWPRVVIVHKNKLNPPQSPFTKGGNSPLFKRGVRGDFNGIGPFVNGRELKHVLRVLRKIIPYRTCKNPYNKPCLQWHLGLCPAHSTVLLPEQAQRARRKPDPSTSAAYGGLRSGNKLENYLNSLNSLSQFLRLYAGEPIRIEAYDISNIQGKFATGSMIVFYGNKPSKSDYRKFRIKTVRGVNDVAMINEVLKRRFGHPEWPLPDLILIDGGIAQLNAAKLEIGNWPALGRAEARPGKLEIPLFALAKREDEIYTEYSSKPLKISRLPESLRVTFQHIRDEAHRFAIFYYRYLHGQVVKIRQVRRRRTKIKNNM